MVLAGCLDIDASVKLRASFAFVMHLTFLY